MSQLQTPGDDYNADTMPLTDEDAYIDTIAGPELQSLLCWQQYLIKLRNGAWGDHIAIQGIANMLTLRINVLSSQYATITPIEPTDNSAQHELYVGLILQYHYVGLDKSNIASPTTDSSVDQPGNSQLENTIDDEKGDEHTRQITGGPQASTMFVENPQAIAPAEGQKPLSMMTDSHFEAMSNPDKFCYSTGTFKQ